jgi:hypothetical protein
MGLPPLPTFVIIGAQKCATRWLRMKLGEHPQVFTAEEELHFWNLSQRIDEAALAGYRAQFRGWSGEPIVGEATPGYTIRRHKPPEIARRMREAIPDVRLIAVLRNPIDRANSAVRHHIKHHRLPEGARLADVVRKHWPPERDPLCIVSGGWYAQSLAPFMFRFDEQLLVLFHDDVVRDPARPYADALRHVGADPGFVPERLSEVVFSNERGGPDDPHVVSAEERAELWNLFEEDVAQLEMMLDADLSHWRPGGVAPDANASAATG